MYGNVTITLSPHMEMRVALSGRAFKIINGTVSVSLSPYIEIVK